MLKKNALVTLICATTLAISLQGIDAHGENAKFQYIKNLAGTTSMIFEDTFTINALEKRIDDVSSLIKTNLKQNSDSTLEKAFTRINSHAKLIYNDILMISNNLKSIKTDSKSLNHFRKFALNFSKERDALKEELEPKSKLHSLKKRKFPPVSDAKKDILSVLLTYAETFVLVAQKAIADFAILDKDLFLQEKSPLKKNERQQKWTPGFIPTKESSIDKPTIDTLYAEFIENDPSSLSPMQMESMQYNKEQAQ